MLRNIVEKKKAVYTVLAALMVLALLTVWPLRLWSEDIVKEDAGQVQSTSDLVNAAMDAGEYFTAQYDHLQTLRVWIDSKEKGEEFEFQLFSRNEDGSFQLLAEEAVSFPETLPGFAQVPVDCDLTVGEEYIYIVRGHNSAFRVGFVSQTYSADADGGEDAPLYRTAFYHDTSVEGAAVKTGFTYRVPLRAGKSALACLGILAVFAVLSLCVRAYYKKKPEKNTLTNVLTVLQFTLTPFVLAFGAFFFITVWPLELFDDRAEDIITYEIGVVLTVLILLYAIWHKRCDAALREKVEEKAPSLIHVLLILCIFYMMVQACAYMNAVNDFTHHRCEARIAGAICMMILLMGRKEDNIHPVPLACILGGSVTAIVAYAALRMEPGEKEYLWNNQVLAARCFAWVLFAGAAASLAVMLFHERRRKTKTPDFVLYTVLPCSALIVLMLANRGGRTWILLLAGMILMFIARFVYFSGRKQWLRDVCWGILLHFLYCMAYSMLFRYYYAYRYTRFGMIFHTVTITGYYLVIAETAAAALFLAKYRKILLLKKEGTRITFRQTFSLLYKELMIFGAVTSYILMSLTRASVGIACVIVLFALVLIFAGGGSRISWPFRSIAWLLVCSMISLPCIFTCQRLISTAVGRPQKFSIEAMPDEVARNPKWNSRYFMSIDIFLRDFGNRVIGGNVGDEIFYGTGWYNTQGVEKEDDSFMEPWTGSDAREESPYPCGLYASLDSPVLVARGEDGSLESGDVTNGRITIWKSYLEQITMAGHTQMGAVLPDGEIAVHAHNNYLQMAYDCGMIAGFAEVLALIVLMVRGIVYFRRYRNRTLYAALPFLMITAFAGNGLVEWFFHFCNPFTIAMLLCAAPLLIREDDEKQ